MVSHNNTTSTSLSCKNVQESIIPSISTLMPNASSALPNKVVVYVPSTVDINHSAPEQQIAETKNTATVLSRLFGGCTTTQAVGCYVDNSGELITESVMLCYAYCSDDALRGGIRDIVALCLALKKHMGQEAISLEVNNKLYFI